MKRYVSLINIGGDYCGMGCADEYADCEYEDEFGRSRASNGVWVSASEAQAEIDRLQAEVERLNATLEANTKANDAIVAELLASEASARNDALEEAAQEIEGTSWGNSFAYHIRSMKTGEA